MLDNKEKTRIFGLMEANPDVYRHLHGIGEGQEQREKRLQIAAGRLLVTDNGPKGMDWITCLAKRERDEKLAAKYLLWGGAPLLYVLAVVTALVDRQSPFYLRRSNEYDESHFVTTVKIRTMPDNSHGSAEKEEMERFKKTGVPQVVVGEKDRHERRSWLGTISAKTKADDAAGLLSVAFADLLLTGVRRPSGSDGLAGLIAAQNGIEPFREFYGYVRQGLPYAAVGMREVIDLPDYTTLREATFLSLLYIENACAATDDKIMEFARLKIVKSILGLLKKDAK